MGRDDVRGARGVHSRARARSSRPSSVPQGVLREDGNGAAVDAVGGLVSYRAPPAVLPPCAMWEWFRVNEREAEARERAAAVPCPAFTVDPFAALLPMHKVFAYVPPPAKKGPAVLPLNVPE